MPIKITIVAGARPNFIKIAPIISEIKKRQKKGNNIAFRLVHTGQHYDEKMSGNFFTELNIPEPNINLNAGGGTQAEQTAQIMIAFEKELIKSPTDLVIVVGDVTSTLACSITAKKLGITVAHVEAGIRSFDLGMPEEINRIVTDSISDYFFTTSRRATQLLFDTGKNNSQVFFVGNVMIDTLKEFEPKFKKPSIYKQHNLIHKKYLVLTLHRPSNVDQKKSLKELITFICEKSNDIPIVFPIHPRTRQNFDLKNLPKNLILLEPLGYLEFNYLVKNALGVLTDSGGITEEATVMQIPCITLRENTERPETIEIGTNVLAGKDTRLISKYLDKMLSEDWKNGKVPELWDGKTASRIINVILNNFSVS